MRGSKMLAIPMGLAAGLVAAVAWAQPPTPAPTRAAQPTMGKDATFAHCAKACADCALECEKCAKHCTVLAIQGKKDHQESAALCCDCAAICAAGAKASAVKGPLAGLICEACAKACDKCGAACDKHASHDEHMARCAKACKDCATACRAMVSAAGH